MGFALSDRVDPESRRLLLTRFHWGAAFFSVFLDADGAFAETPVRRKLAGCRKHDRYQVIYITRR